MTMGRGSISGARSYGIAGCDLAVTSNTKEALKLLQEAVRCNEMKLTDAFAAEYAIRSKAFLGAGITRFPDKRTESFSLTMRSHGPESHESSELLFEAEWHEEPINRDLVQWIWGLPR